MLFAYGRKDLIKILKLVNKVQSKVTCTLSPSNLEIVATDSSNTTMIGVTVPKTAFKAYKVEEAVSFAIELSTAKGDSSKGLIKILESLEWDIVSLVEITKTALTLDCGYASLHLLQDIDGVRKSPRVPELVYPCAYTIQTSEFFNYVKLVRTVEEHVVLTEDHISSNVTSDLSNSIRIDITPLASVDRMNIVRSVFSAKMLLNTAKELAVVVPTVQVEIGNDLPVKFSGKGAREEEIWIIHAPRIEYD
jgi:hypothetical protein